jgi:plasmid stability protein
MTNLTIALDEAIVRKARIRAIHEGTSVSAKVREFLSSYAQGSDRQQIAGLAFIDAARRSQANSEGARWTRDDAHDRPYPSPKSARTS